MPFRRGISLPLLLIHPAYTPRWHFIDREFDERASRVGTPVEELATQGLIGSTANMTANDYLSFGPKRWSACIELLFRPPDLLNAIQRPAALVLKYDGCVQNGGHTSHFDCHDPAEHGELLQALRTLGAHEQARILASAYSLKKAAENEQDDNADWVWESIEDLDRKYYKLIPDVPELLALYFNNHPESFPK